MANALNFPRPPTQSRILHQLLHGYSEGHRLLESSFKLKDDLTRLMLRMSDLSGSSVVSGFEEYITGYPLASINAYALARTWYASEMPRPGCVWTHTLVIPALTMSEIPSLQDLVTLFKRPTQETFRGQYSDDLMIDEVLHQDSIERIRKPEHTRQELHQLLWSYYGMGDRPIVLAAKNSGEFENTVFALWSQQWPSLRLGFTFCTGSLATRSFAGRPFDLQCVPTALTREVLLETAAESSAEPILIPPIELTQPKWISSVANDAMNPLGGPVRKFLWAASDITTPRAEFVPFITVFNALSESSDLSMIISQVAKLFPEPSTARSLKCLLFGEQSAHAWPSSHEEQDLLFAIATTSDYQSFDAEALFIRERGAKLCIEKPDSARWLVGELFRSSLNPLGEEILAGLISAMEPETARQVTSQQPQFLPALFRAKPSLATSSQLWLAGKDRKRELFESVASHEHLDSALVAGVISALLDSGSEVFIRRALDLWGKDAVFPALDWTEAHDGAMSETCRGALTFHLPSVMDWVEATPTRSFESLIAVAHVVAPFSDKILQYDSAVWLRTLHFLQNSPKETERSYICTFLLALAFGNAPPSPLDLVSESFERVHETARRELLSDNAWIILEPLVPELSWLSNWDKCERLRRGLISAFLRHQWSASELKRRIKDHELLRQLLKSARRVDGGEEFFRSLHVSG
jgi:hypothetical protein